MRVIREILFLEEPEHGKTDITTALEYLQKVCTRRSVVFLISDFICEDYSQAMMLASKKHDLIPVTITDPRESELPDIGFIDLMDAETGERILIDTSDKKVRRTFHALGLRREEELKKQFRKMNSNSICIETDKSYVDSLVKFFKMREKRMAQ